MNTLEVNKAFNTHEECEEYQDSIRRTLSAEGHTVIAIMCDSEIDSDKITIKNVLYV